MRKQNSTQSSFQVDMMRLKKDNFLYYEDEQVQVLGMRYVADHLAMFAFLPKKQDGLEEFEKTLTGEQLLKMISNCYPGEVEVNFLLRD